MCTIAKAVEHLRSNYKKTNNLFGKESTCGHCRQQNSKMLEGDVLTCRDGLMKRPSSFAVDQGRRPLASHGGVIYDAFGPISKTSLRVDAAGVLRYRRFGSRGSALARNRNRFVGGHRLQCQHVEETMKENGTALAVVRRMLRTATADVGSFRIVERYHRFADALTKSEWAAERDECGWRNLGYGTAKVSAWRPAN